MGTQPTKPILFLRKVRQSKLKLPKSLSHLTLKTQQRSIILRSKTESLKDCRIKFRDGKARFRRLANTAKPFYLVKNERFRLRFILSRMKKILIQIFCNYAATINFEILGSSKIIFNIIGVSYIIGSLWYQ